MGTEILRSYWIFEFLFKIRKIIYVTSLIENLNVKIRTMWSKILGKIF